MQIGVYVSVIRAIVIAVIVKVKIEQRKSNTDGIIDFDDVF